MRLCADFHAGPSKEYPILFLLLWKLLKENETFTLNIFCYKRVDNICTAIYEKQSLPWPWKLVFRSSCRSAQLIVRLNLKTVGLMVLYILSYKHLKKPQTCTPLPGETAQYFPLRSYFSRYICWVFCLRWVITKVNYIKMLILYSNTLLHLLTSPCYSSISKPSKNALI